MKCATPQFLDDYFTFPPQSACPQRQMISVLVPIPSQWGLQYLEFLGGTQLQAAFAHFFAAAIVPPSCLRDAGRTAGMSGTIGCRNGGKG